MYYYTQWEKFIAPVWNILEESTNKFFKKDIIQQKLVSFSVLAKAVIDYQIHYVNMPEMFMYIH